MNQRQLVLLGLVLASGLGQTFETHAADLKSPFALDTSATLPRGVRNPRFINVFTSVENRFGDDGGVVPLGNALNKTVTWNDMYVAQEDRAKETTLRGLIRKNGLDDKGGPGATTGEVNTFATVRVAALAVGVTDRLTIAGVLPIVNIDVSASMGFVANTHGNELIGALANQSTPTTADEAKNKLDNAIPQKLMRYGYESIPEHQTISGVGDLQLIGKYRVYTDEEQGVAIKSTFTLPTGIAPNADKALDIPTGDGRFALGLGAVYDRFLPWSFRWNTYANYNAMLPRSHMRRIPTSVWDTLSPDKEDLHENLRSQFLMGTGLDHQFAATGITVGAGYAFQYMTRASYDPGTLVADVGRYSLLSDVQPLQSLHSILVSAGFSTVEWYRAKKFFYPFQVNVAYTHPLAGRNVAKNDLIAGELVLFF